MLEDSILFDEKKFIKIVIDLFLSNDELCIILYDNYFKSYFPTDEICEKIRTKYYSNDSKTLYTILLHKVQDVLLE
jgi:hypothetical protein